MADCEQCAALQRQNDFLSNDRDGYVQLLTDDNNKLRAEVERLKAVEADYDDHEREMIELEEDNARLTAEIAWHVEDKNAWQDTQAAHFREVTLLIAEVDSLKSMVIAQEKLLRSKDAENEKLRKDLDEAQREITQLYEDAAGESI